MARSRVDPRYSTAATCAAGPSSMGTLTRTRPGSSAVCTGPTFAASRCRSRYAARIARSASRGRVSRTDVAARGGQQLGRRHQGRPGEDDVGLQDGPRDGAEDQRPVPVLGHAGDLDARAQVAARVQLGEDPLAPALDRFLLEERAADLGRDVGRGRSCPRCASGSAGPRRRRTRPPSLPAARRPPPRCGPRATRSSRIRSASSSTSQYVASLPMRARARARTSGNSRSPPSTRTSLISTRSNSRASRTNAGAAEADALAQRVGERPVVAPLRASPTASIPARKRNSAW